MNKKQIKKQIIEFLKSSELTKGIDDVADWANDTYYMNDVIEDIQRRAYEWSADSVSDLDPDLVEDILGMDKRPMSNWNQYK